MSSGESYDIDALLREFRMIGRDSAYCPESEGSFTPEYKPRGGPINEKSKDDGRIYHEQLLTYYCSMIHNLASKPVQPQLHQDNRWMCQFCRNNGETFHFYRSHRLKDETQRVCCPVLRKYVCPICGATGDFAHTLKYCPFNAERPSVPLITRLKGLRNSMGRRGGRPNSH